MLLNRLAARLFDVIIPFVAGLIISYNFSWQTSPNFYYYLSLAVLLFSTLFSALCLHFFGSTVGHALFGVGIKDRNSANLSFFCALRYFLFLNKKQDIEIFGIRRGYLKSMLAWGILIATVGASFTGEEISTQLTKSIRQHITKSIVPPPLHPENWVRFSCNEKHFSVDFPTTPKVELKRLDIFSANKSLNYNEYKSSLEDKVHYCVSFIDFPSSYKWVGAKTLLQESLNILVDNTPNTEVIYKEFTHYKKHRALDFHLKQGTQEVVGRLVLYGNTLYRLNVVYSPENATELQQENFLQSLDFE